MIDKDSELSKFYPLVFDTFLEQGKPQFERYAILPFIDSEILNKKMDKFENEYVSSFKQIVDKINSSKDESFFYVFFIFRKKTRTN